MRYTELLAQITASPDARRAEVDRLYDETNRRISPYAPAEIHGWAGLWEYTALPEKRLHRQGEAYVRGEVDASEVERAGKQLIDAWRRAHEAYRTATSDRAA